MNNCHSCGNTLKRGHVLVDGKRICFRCDIPDTSEREIGRLKELIRGLNDPPFTS
jgi:hypothetical protein